MDVKEDPNETNNTRQDIEDELLKIGNDVHWDIILSQNDSDLLPKLLTIAKLKQKPDSSASDEQLQTYLDWMEVFFKSMGFQQLLHIFHNCAIDNLPLLATLLPLINSFLVDAILYCKPSMTDSITKIFNLCPNNDAFLKDFNAVITKHSGMKISFEDTLTAANEFDEDLFSFDDQKTELNENFEKLTKNIIEKYANSLIESLNFNQVLIKSFNVFKAANTESVISNASKLWILSLLYQPSLISDFFQTIQKDTSFIIHMLQSTDEDACLEFATSLFRLCAVLQTKDCQNNSDEIIGFFLKNVLLNDLPKCNVENNPNLHIYLQTLAFLLHQYTCSEPSHNNSEFTPLFEYVINELKLYKSREAFHSEERDLCGLMAILSVLLLKHKPFRQHCVDCGFMQQIWNDFLFANGQTKMDNLPKCKQDKTKTLAFRLIILCITDIPQAQAIIIENIRSFQNEFSTSRPVLSWEYAPAKSIRSGTGYVGLRNLGLTDFMNCMFQQFYMIASFRNKLICAGMEIANKLTEDECNDSVLFQLTKMFCYLSLSTRQAYDTRDFCKSWKDDTGKPIDIRVQCDVHEFYNIFTERIGIELLNTKYADLFQSYFGTEIVTQMICKGGCERIRERKQNNMAISVSVRNKRNLEESLKNYVTMDKLEGVQCDKCQKKCDTLRREVMGKLPNTILFQLNRFELNFQTFESEKVYDRFEFPFEIDLKQFTKVGVSETENKTESKENTDEYYKYQLCGIVIHSGNEENGHYFSYIKDCATEEWFEFNDVLIKPYDISNISEDAFGGHNPVNNAEILTSAYGLIYRRKSFEEQKSENCDPISELIRESLPKLHSDILDNNACLMRDIQLYNIPYFEFMHNLMCVATPNSEQKENDNEFETVINAKYCTILCLKYLSKTAKKNKTMQKMMHYFKFAYEGNIELCSWFLGYLSKKESSLETYILTSRDVLVVASVGDLIIHCLRQLQTVNKSVDAFMDRMIDLLEIAPKQWFRFVKYFKIFHEFSLMGSAQRNCLIDKKMITHLGDFYLGVRSPYATPEKVYPQMGSRMYPPKFDGLIQTLSVLICGCHTPQTRIWTQEYETKQENSLLSVSSVALTYKDANDSKRECLHSLSKEDETLPHCRFLYERLIGEAHHSVGILEALNKIIVHWSFGDKAFSEEVARIIKDGVDKSGADQVRTFLAIMEKFIKIEDAQQRHRFSKIHENDASVNANDRGIFHFIRCYRIQHQPFTFECMKGVTAMMSECRPYLMYMISRRDEWFWWDAYLGKYTQSEHDYLHGTPNTELKQERMKWYAEEYVPFFEKYYECLVYGFITDLIKQIGFEKNIPLDIMPEFVKFFW